MPPHSIQNESSLSFIDSFWGKDLNGIETLFQRMESGHQTCENLHAIYLGRAKVEADQGSHLMVISRTVLRDEGETGNLVAALDTFSQEVAANAQSHLDLARKIESDIADPLHTFSQNYINQVNDCRNSIEHHIDTRDRCAAMIVEAGDRFNAEQKRLGGDRAGRASRLAQERLRDIHREYQSAIADFEGSVKELHEEWKNYCVKLQDLEEQRIELLILNIWEYSNLYSANLLDKDESFERLRQSLEQCQPPNEIDIFLSEKATGREVPAPLDYLHHYIQKNGKSMKAETVVEPPQAVNKSLPPRPDRSSSVAKNTLSKIQTNPVRHQPQPPQAPTKETLESKVAKRMDIRRKPINSNSVPSRSAEANRNDEMSTIGSQTMDTARSKKQPIGELEDLLKRFENGDSGQFDVAKKPRSSYASVRYGGNEATHANPPSQPPRPDKNQRQSMFIPSEQSEKHHNQASHADRRQSAPPPSSSRSLSPTATSSTEILSPPKSPRPQSQVLSPRLPSSDSPITPPLSISPTEICSSPVFLQQAYHPPQESDQWKVNGGQTLLQQQHQYFPQSHSPVPQHHQQLQQQPSQHAQQQPQQHPQQHLQQFINPAQQPQQYMRSQTLPANYATTSPLMAPHAPPSPAMVNSPWLSPQPHMMQTQQSQNGHFEPPRSPNVHAAQASPMMAPRSPMMRSPMIQPRSPMIQAGPVTPVMQPSSAQKPATLPDGRPVMHWAQAKYDYSAQDGTELGFRKGSLLAVLGSSADEGWWLAELWDEQSRCSYGHGTVPSNFMQIL